MTNTDTPRTNSATEVDVRGMTLNVTHVPAEFAHQLERELTESQDDLERSMFWHGETRERADKAEAEIDRLKVRLEEAIEIAEMFSQVKGLHHHCNCAMCQKLAALKSQIK